MELNYDSMMDYYRCPLLYRIKHIMKVKRANTENFRYQSSLIRATMFYYYSLMNGKHPTEDEMMVRWEKAWRAETPSIEDILFQGKRIGASYDINAIKWVRKFFKEERAKDFVPIVVDTEFRVEAGNYHVVGSMDLVKEVKEGRRRHIELVSFNSSSHKADPFFVRHDFKITLQSFAFRQLFEATEDRLIMKNLRLGQEVETSRNEEEYKRMMAVVNNVGDAILQEKFHPIVSYQCKSCLYQDICDKYKF